MSEDDFDLGMEDLEFDLGERVRMWSESEGAWKIGTIRGLIWLGRSRAGPDPGPNPEYREVIIDGTAKRVTCHASDLRRLDEATVASEANRGPAATSASEGAMAASGRIEIDPYLGQPVIRGARIPVAVVLRKLGKGVTEAELVDAYPVLTSEDIRAAILFAAEAIGCPHGAEGE